MRFDVMITYTSKTSFAVEATDATEAYAKAMAEQHDPSHVTYNVELNKGVK